MEAVKIVLLCIVSAVIYGILHDQVTARVCLEYFTIGHPPVFHTESPTLLAFGWGVFATWWMGLLMGIPLAIVSRSGPGRKVNAVRLIRPLVRLLIVMACASLAAGVIGFVAANAGWVWLVEPMWSMVERSKHSAFLADLWAHSAAYGVGIIGAVVICCQIWKQRRQPGLASRCSLADIPVRPTEPVCTVATAPIQRSTD